MDNAVYIALSRQVALTRSMAVSANNIANTNTTGYTGEQMIFKDYLVDGGNRKEGRLAFTQDLATWRNTQTGPLRLTGNPLDVAISGPGYFQVETPQGTRYTKAGDFRMSEDGTLVTVDGFAVLDATGGRITIPEDAQNIEINDGGNISVDNEELSTIGMVEFADEQKMERLSGTLFRMDEPALPAENSRLSQGTLEGANISPITEIVKTTEISRGASNTAKLIEVIYDLQRKASNIYSTSNK